MSETSGSRWGDVAYSLRRLYVDRFHETYVARLPAATRVLDVGGRRVRKRGAFDLDRFGLRVVTLDISAANAPHVRADAARLPFPDRSFDAVVCSEVLEHVSDPASVLAEIARVLRPGGELIACAPFMYQIHADPDDFGRFTPSFWRLRLDRAGMDVVAIEPQGAFWSVLVDQIRAYACDGLAGPSLYQRAARVPLRLVLPLLKRFAVWRDAQPAVRGSAVLAAFTTGYGVVAVRRA